MTASISTAWMPTGTIRTRGRRRPREMVDFILAFTEYTREKPPGFGVFPQNAEGAGCAVP